MQLLLKPTGLCRGVGEKGFRANCTRGSRVVAALSHPNQNYGSWDFDQGSPPLFGRARDYQNANYGSWDFETVAETPAADEQLLAIASQLLSHVRVTHSELAPQTTPEVYAHHVAAAALAAAEAHGAIPPLSAVQRKAFEAALEEVLKHSPPGFGEIYEAEDPAHWFDAAQGGAGDIVLKPEFRGLFEELMNLKLSGGWGDAGGVAYDSVAQGGEMGNISLPHSRSAAGVPEGRTVVNPAEGLTESTQRAAEADFMRMEVTAFEPHIKAVADPGAHHDAIGGDAPSAGGGAQTAGDSSEAGAKSSRPPAHDF